MDAISLRKRIKALEKPLVIFICGMQGTRKSSTAVQLAAKLRIKVVIGTDQIRDIAKIYNDSPFLKRPTHNCWQLIGERTPANIAAGYLEQSASIKIAVLGVLELAKKRGENMLLEGVHLFPPLYAELREDANLTFFHFILSTENEKLHSENIAEKISLRHGKEKAWPEERMEDIREMQKFILSQSNRGVRLINSGNPAANVRAILKILGEAI